MLLLALRNKDSGVCPGEPGFPPPTTTPFQFQAQNLATGNGLADAFRSYCACACSCMEEMESFEDMMLEFMG